jgi:RNA-dependent RNA polymerase
MVIFMDSTIYRFNTCLDSPKTGHRLKHNIFLEDQAKYGRSRPSCMVPVDHAESAIQTYQSTLPVERNKSLGTFILDSLVTAGHELRTRHLQAYDRHLTSLDHRPDGDLMEPFKAAKKRAEQMKAQNYPKFSEELDAVDVHLKHIQTLYQKFWATPRKPPSSRATRGSSRRELDAAASDIARQFVEGPPGCAAFLTPDLTAIKASRAYALSASFGFAMAYRDLCTIKAMASEHVPTARTFAETMSIAPSFLRVLGENSGE